MKNLTYLILFILIAACTVKSPVLQLPAIISDNMVLQQQKQVNLWGWSDPDVTIEIEASWGAKATATTSTKGDWMTSIETPTFGGPFTITIKAGNTEKTINNVMIGEVWLCSGQSNMEMPLKGWGGAPVENSESEIAAANFPDVRMFTVAKLVSVTSVEDCIGSWEVTTPETAGNFSATGYYFGMKIYKELGVPVGLIHSSWGGTPAESWTTLEYVQNVQGYEGFASKLEEGIENFKAYNEFLSSLETMSISDLPKTNPYQNLDLHDSIYNDINTDISGWKDLKVPGLWEYSVLPGFDGVVWVEKDFEYADELYPEGLQLYLGPVDDMDATYLNGVEIGRNEIDGVYSMERIYNIPVGLLKKGNNRIAIKITDTGGGGGIFGRKGPAIMKGELLVSDLSGTWKFKPAATFQANKIYVFADGEKSYDAYEGKPFQFDQNTPTVLYNGMISPLVPYTLQGAIWYQGEANVGRGKQYETLFPAMINSWREVWNQGNFPFYFVQIAPYNYGSDANETVSEVRFAQLKSLTVDNTGMAVTMDIGDPSNIHPANKKDVGDRLALWALAKTYGQSEVVCSGPLYKNATFDKNKVVVEFTYAENGLELKGAESYFEIAGADGVFYPAKATIEEGKIVALSPKVKVAKQIRYAWCDDCEPNLFNVDGLPASPFKAEAE